jgi:hypothetical protein
MTSLVDAARIAELVQSLPEYESAPRRRVGSPVYAHMGATLADAVLQAGLRYETVVVPRVRRLLSRWPRSRTTSAFVGVAQRHGICEVLAWGHPRKPQLVLDVASLLLCERVQTEWDLADWLRNPDSQCALLALHGIGPKTVDYLRKLVGHPVVAVDRHLRRFAARAGVHARGYDDMVTVLELSAEMLGVDCGTLDSIIWHCMSRRPSAA